jgi:hypothetical protein
MSMPELSGTETETGAVSGAVSASRFHPPYEPYEYPGGEED